jgi:FkbM family methyltransferase
MTSWDCFDTLIARRYIHPYTIFDEVGKRLGIPSEKFRRIRIKAEEYSNGTYDDIYNHLPGIDKNIELEVEKEHLFPIVENINAVKDGDIIVSDMYLTVEQVTELLKSCGLNKDVKIYVTWGGKAHGWIWDKVGHVDLHVGDNFISDVEVPKRYNIKTKFYTGHEMTDLEKKVYEVDTELACWMRYIRLSSPYKGVENLIWNDQADLNIPMLALASLELPQKPLAFTYRTSANWLSIYQAVVGGNAKAYQTSRACYYSASPEFVKHFRKEILAEQRTIIDVQGCGRSIDFFISKHNLPTPGVIYLTGPVAEKFTSLVRNLSEFDEWMSLKTDASEKLNLLDIGAIEKWDSDGIKRLPCENNPRIVKIQQDAVKVATESAKYFKIKQNKNLLLMLLEKINNCITNDLVSITWTLDNTVKYKHELIAEKFLNFSKKYESYSQIKQDVFALFCLGESPKYFLEFGACDGVMLSNTFLLETYYGWNGLLVEPTELYNKHLKRIRTSKIDTLCISDKTGESVEFTEVPNIPCISGITNSLPNDIWSQHRRDYGKTYNVETISLNDLFNKHECPTNIDYVSIDTEGTEYLILNAYDFSRSFSVLTIEHNDTETKQPVIDLLTSKGYIHILPELSMHDSWFVSLEVLYFILKNR